MSDIQKQSGVIVEVTPKESGNGKNGTWTKQIFVLGVDIQKKDGSTFQKKLALEAFNKDFNVRVGQKVEAVYSVSSNEYNGRWYTNINLLEFTGASNTPANTPMPAAQQSSANDDDLPF